MWRRITPHTEYKQMLDINFNTESFECLLFQNSLHVLRLHFFGGEREKSLNEERYQKYTTNEWNRRTHWCKIKEIVWLRAKTLNFPQETNIIHMYLHCFAEEKVLRGHNNSWCHWIIYYKQSLHTVFVIRYHCLGEIQAKTDKVILNLHRGDLNRRL